MGIYQNGVYPYILKKGYTRGERYRTSYLKQFCSGDRGIHILSNVSKSSYTPFCWEETDTFLETSQPIISGWRHPVKKTAD